jgi:hypothetical protein
MDEERLKSLLLERRKATGFGRIGLVSREIAGLKAQVKEWDEPIGYWRRGTVRVLLSKLRGLSRTFDDARS